MLGRQVRFLISNQRSVASVRTGWVHSEFHVADGKDNKLPKYCIGKKSNSLVNFAIRC